MGRNGRECEVRSRVVPRGIAVRGVPGASVLLNVMMMLEVSTAYASAGVTYR
jgi:hypothetical protein